MSGPDDTASGRIHSLDGVRAVAIVGVVLVHSLLSYLETPIGWAIRDESATLVADFVVWCTRAFLLPVFFWLSGLLAGRVVEQRGITAFLRGRSKRILVPLLVFLVPISVSMNAMWDWGRELAGRGVVVEAVPQLQASELPVTLGHLWFLYYLLIVSFAAVVFVAAGRLISRLVGENSGSESQRAAFAFPVGVTAVLVAVLWWSGKMQLDTPLGFVPDVEVLVYHALFFAWGWCLASKARSALKHYAEAMWIWGVAAVVFIGMSIPDLLAGVDTCAAPSWMGIVGSAGFTVSLVALVVGCSARIFDGHRRRVRLVSDSAYWTYIVHLPLVVSLQIGFSQIGWPGLVEFSIIFAVAIGFSLVTYRYVIQKTVLSDFIG